MIVCYALKGWDIAPGAVSCVSHSVSRVWSAKIPRPLLVLNKAAVEAGSKTGGALRLITIWKPSSSTVGLGVLAARAGLGTHFWVILALQDSTKCSSRWHLLHFYGFQSYDTLIVINSSSSLVKEIMPWKLWLIQRGTRAQDLILQNWCIRVRLRTSRSVL